MASIIGPAKENHTEKEHEMPQTLINAMADLDLKAVAQELRECQTQQIPSLELFQNLQEGLNIVGQRYEEKVYHLSELIMSAEIFKEAMGLLEGDVGPMEPETKGIFVTGTIYGDTHDIGKNIVTTVMSCNGFKVVDLGVNVSTPKFLEAIRKHRPQVLGISCLLTTAIESVKECIGTIRAEGLDKDLKILIGGSPCDQAAANYVGADAYCRTAQDSVLYSKKLLGLD